MKQGKGKNNQFKEVRITTNTIQGEPAIVEAIKVDGTLAKLSRNERKILASYKSKTYVENIIKTFGNPNILADGFCVYKDSICKFTYTK
jgi:hypothetical protein